MIRGIAPLHSITISLRCEIVTRVCLPPKDSDSKKGVTN